MFVYVHVIWPDSQEEHSFYNKMLSHCYTSINAICGAICRMTICRYQETQLKISFYFFLNIKNIFVGVCGNKRATPSFENELVQLYMIIFVIKCSQEADNGLFLISHAPSKMFELLTCISLYIQFILEVAQMFCYGFIFWNILSWK